MKICLEELEAPQRAGGIEEATKGLCQSLSQIGTCVLRSSDGPTRGIDCVHLHGIWSPRLASRMVGWQRNGLPCIVTPHGMLQPWALQHKRVKKALAWWIYQRAILQRADVLHATSQTEAEQFIKLGLRAPVALIPWGVETPETAQHARSKVFWTSEAERTALFVGRIYPVKGLSMLVEAWDRVQPQGWKMKVVGPDEAGHRAKLEASLRRSRCAAAFEFTGPINGKDKEIAYRHASLFIMPSFTENFGMAIAEALSHGLPVVTTKGTPWKMLEANHCGWWVSPSVDALASALEEATNLSPQELQTMGQRARDLIREKFSWEKAASDMNSVYNWTLGRGVKPGCVVTD